MGERALVVTPDHLRCWTFFANLGDDALEQMAQIVEGVEWDGGSIVFNAGTPADTLYLVVEGWVDIVAGEDDQDQLLAAVTAGDILGWSALVEPYVYTASARCATPASALAVPGAELRALLQADAALCFTLMNRLCRIIAGRLRAARSQLVGMYVAH